MDRLLIAGTSSGSGKTSISSGIMSVLSDGGAVQPYKIGPDFIDPMYHRALTGRPSRNLDGYMMPEDAMRGHFARTSAGADIAVLEGVRGLYEGLEALSDAASTAQLAKSLRCPVVLVVNARSLTRSAAAMVNGFRSFDPDVNIAGVILNNVSGEGHRRKLTEAMAHYTDVEVLGVVRRRPEESLPQRHLGLHTLHDGDALNGLRERLRSLVEEVDIDRLKEIASEAPALEAPEEPARSGGGLEGLIAAVPDDRAFCFYYPENIEALEAAGATTVRYSPVDGDMLPEADIHYLGGGYPELYAAELAGNRDFLEGLENANEEGAAMHGECGGMMVLCQDLKDSQGRSHRMAGVFPASAEMAPQRQGPCYVEATARGDGRRLRAHEFHYSRVRLHKELPYAFDLLRGSGIDGSHDGMVSGNAVGTYMHRHAVADQGWLRMLATMAQRHRG